jgi:mannose-6-phosphate isomerase-like protein (cupin superfamily)
MKHINTRRLDAIFKPILRSQILQAAIMALKPGQSSSEKPEDEHPKSEQWLFVISGRGQAKTNKRTLKLSPGSLLLIGKNEPHQITNTAKAPLKTINFYAPPAYTSDGDVKPSVQKSR